MVEGTSVRAEKKPSTGTVDVAAAGVADTAASTTPVTSERPKRATTSQARAAAAARTAAAREAAAKRTAARAAASKAAAEKAAAARAVAGVASAAAEAEAANAEATAQADAAAQAIRLAEAAQLAEAARLADAAEAAELAERARAADAAFTQALAATETTAPVLAPVQGPAAAPASAAAVTEVISAPVVPPASAPARKVKASNQPRMTTPNTTTSVPTVPISVPPAVNNNPVVLSVSNLTKSFGQNLAVDGIDIEVRAGSFYGIVGPNGAGKTTTLSMITGLLRPDSGSINVNGIDVWSDPIAAKRVIGVLPDRLRLFDRLTGAQLMYYSGILRGIDNDTVRARSADLAAAFGLEDALNRLVADYSAGMTKKIALACAMIHSPRVLILDEPFESVDPVSAVNVTEILQKYVASGGTVVLSSHGMDMIQRVCDRVAIIVQGRVLASGTIDEVRGEMSLEDKFVELAGGRKVAEGMEWLHSFSD